jgi:hypothetical protein
MFAYPIFSGDIGCAEASEALPWKDASAANT